MSKEAMKLALEALDIVKIHFTQNRHVNDAITALREALAKPDFWEGYEPEPVKPAPEAGFPASEQQKPVFSYTPDMDAVRRAEKEKADKFLAHLAQQALDKKAENARELGLDYEPAKDNSNYRFDPPGLDPSHQKPVAWWIPKAKQFCLPSSDGTRPFAKAWEPLYTSPPAQRKPLTDEAIATVYWGATGQSLRPQDNVLAHNFARSIEAAHGIKENT